MTVKEFKEFIPAMQAVVIKGRLSRMNRDPLGKFDELDQHILVEAQKWGNPRAEDILSKRFLHVVMNHKPSK